MSALLTRLCALFVEPSPAREQALTPTAATAAIADVAPWRTAIGSASRAIARPPTVGSGIPPSVAVLCVPSRRRVAASSFALAMARTLRAPCAIAAAVGMGGPGPNAGIATLLARRIATRLRGRGEHASASGRLVWLSDRRVAAPEGVVAGDPAAAAAASCADLGRAAAVAGVPAVLAVPLARTAALDRALAWHDAIVVIREPDATAEMMDRVLASLAALGPPVVCVRPPSRVAAALAVMGLHAPSCMVQAARGLGVGGGG